MISKRLLFRAKASTFDRVDFEHPEEVGRNGSPRNALGLICARQIEVTYGYCGDIVEDLVTTSPFTKVWERNAEVGNTFRRVRHVDEHQFLGPFKTKRSQQHAIHHAEYRAVCSDSKGKSNHSNDGEPWPLQKHANPESQIANQITHVDPLAF